MYRAAPIALFVLMGLALPAMPAAAERRDETPKATPTAEPDRRKKDRDSDEGSIGRIFRSIGKSEDGDKDRKDRGDREDRSKERDEKRDDDRPRDEDRRERRRRDN